MCRRLSVKSAKHLSILIDKPVKKHYNKIRIRGGDMASLNLEDMQQIQKELQAKYLEKGEAFLRKSVAISSFG